MQLIFGLMLAVDAMVMAFLVMTRQIRLSLTMEFGLTALALGLALAGVSTLESNVCEPMGRLWRLGLIGFGGLLFSIAMLIWSAKPEQRAAAKG